MPVFDKVERRYNADEDGDVDDFHFTPPSLGQQIRYRQYGNPHGCRPNDPVKLFPITPIFPSQADEGGNTELHGYSVILLIAPALPRCSAIIKCMHGKRKTIELDPLPGWYGEYTPGFIRAADILGAFKSKALQPNQITCFQTDSVPFQAGRQTVASWTSIGFQARPYI